MAVLSKAVVFAGLLTVPLLAGAQSILDGVPPASAADIAAVSTVCGQLGTSRASALLGCQRYRSDQDPRLTALTIASSCTSALDAASALARRLDEMERLNRDTERQTGRAAYPPADVALVRNEATHHDRLIAGLGCVQRLGGAPRGPGMDRTTAAKPCNGTIESWQVHEYPERGRAVLNIVRRGSQANLVIETGGVRPFPYVLWLEQNCDMLAAPPRQLGVIDRIGVEMNRLILTPSPLPLRSRSPAGGNVPRSDIYESDVGSIGRRG